VKYAPLTAVDYVCVLCAGAIRSDRAAPPETMWFTTLAGGRKPAHLACLKADKQQLVIGGVA
jgi:hypothetical protein